MKTGARSILRRSTSLAVPGALLALLAACTGHGGGYLAPGHGFSGRASFGFTFSCEDKGGVNPPTGQLRSQLSYTEHGTNPIGASFTIHGSADTLDPVTESMFCIGQNPPTGGNELIFLGRYRPTSSRFPAACPKRETTATPLCRFEVIVRDNDGNRTASNGDYFSIKLSNATDLTTRMDPATVIYDRAGSVEGGNLTVK